MSVCCLQSTDVVTLQQHLELQIFGEISFLVFEPSPATFHFPSLTAELADSTGLREETEAIISSEVARTRGRILGSGGQRFSMLFSSPKRRLPSTAGII